MMMAGAVNPLNMGSEADADLGGFDSGAEMPLGPGPTFLQKAAASCEVVYAFVDKHFFLIFVLVAILVAFAEPSIGNQVEPSITTGYVATIIIFVISGMSLNTSEFIAAVKNVKLNTFVLVYNMGIITILTWLAAQLLGQTPFSKELRDGLIILGTLPTSVSMCVILTTAASGDAAAALFNSTTLNLVGIFLTPAWLLGLLSTHTSISVGEVILTLTIKVVAPLLFGQVIRYIPNSFLQKQLKARKAGLKRIQDIALCCIIYTTFCETFAEGTDATWGDLISTFFIVLFLLITYMSLCWGIMSLKMMNLNRAQRVAGLFSATHKTVALGIPLISAMFDGSSSLGVYSIPLLIYHPLQLIIGSALVPRLKIYVDDEQNKDVQDNDEVC